MRVLVTGGAGFIGSHLVDSLVSRGDDVIVLDNVSTGNLTNLALSKNKIELISGDIRDEALVNQLVTRSDLVFHMAAALGVNTILESPLESISTNIAGSEVVLKAAVKHNKRIIIASTSEIYGKNPKQPLSETDDRVIGAPQKIRWSYSDAKAIEEAIATALHQSQGLAVTTVRLFNTVGPRQTGRYGMVIPRFVQSAINNEPLAVYGAGNQTRVFCHVNDAVNALIKLSEEAKSIGEVYNVGGTGEISIKDLAQRVISQTNSTSAIDFKSYTDAYPAGFEDMQRRVPDITKIKSTIDWAPTKDIGEIINDVANYFKIN